MPVLTPLAPVFGFVFVVSGPLACAPAPAPASAPVTSLAPAPVPATRSEHVAQLPEAAAPEASTTAEEGPRASAARPGQPFDKGQAMMALAGVSTEGCGTPARGHVRLTFHPSGQVTEARVDDGPAVGSTHARCIESRFLAVRISPFGGAPVTVGKSFAPKR